MDVSPADLTWHHRLMRSGFFLGALLFHLILFLMVATWIVFKAPVIETDNSTFQQVSTRPITPPAPPPPAGGEAANHFEPAVQNTPPPATMSVVTTSNATAFAVKAVDVQIPSLPSSMTPPSGSAMQGHEMPGLNSGAGTPFGSLDANGTVQLQGYLYDLKQTTEKKPTKMNPGTYHNVLKQFLAGNWSPSLLNPYYKSPRPLNTSAVFIPTIKADDGPKAFGVANEVQPKMYVIWYKVTAAPSQEGTYHFVGVGDDILVVRVNGKTVLDGSLNPLDPNLRKQQKSFNIPGFKGTCPADGQFWAGTPFHVSAGEQVDIDILIGEEPGGFSNYFLYLQREESTYQTLGKGASMLPVFQVDPKPIHPDGATGSFPPFAKETEAWSAGNKS